jgi:hypothetical protein
MRKWARLLFYCVTAVASLLLVAPAGYGQTGVPDTTHFWTYRLTQPVYLPVGIQVRDQFFPSYFPTQVDSLVRLVNWVRKNGSAVKDTFNHYLWWNIPDKRPMDTTVAVHNQFGSSAVHVSRLEFLLSPAFKNVNPQPPPVAPFINHYLCYRAQGPGPNMSFSLLDEWRQDNQFVYDLEYLCNPCWKMHGQEYAPVDTTNHLALYRIFPTSDQFLPFVRDQFGSGTIQVRQSGVEYLLVPSLKTQVVTDTKRETWGKIKVRYR